MSDWSWIQHRWLRACPNVTPLLNSNQGELYSDIVQEQLCKLQHAVAHGQRPAHLDALVDVLLVTIVAIQSLGVHSGERHHIFSDSLLALKQLAMIDSSTGRVYQPRYHALPEPLGQEPSQIHGNPQESK